MRGSRNRKPPRWTRSGSSGGGSSGGWRSAFAAEQPSATLRHVAPSQQMLANLARRGARELVDQDPLARALVARELCVGPALELLDAERRACGNHVRAAHLTPLSIRDAH